VTGAPGPAEKPRLEQVLQYVRPASPEFYVLLRDLHRIQASGDIGARLQRIDKGETLSSVVRPNLAAAVENAFLSISKILGLDPAAREFRVVCGAVAANDKEIALLTRSIREVFVDLSSMPPCPRRTSRSAGWGRHQRPIWGQRERSRP
jgi:hypothetical protein